MPSNTVLENLLGKTVRIGLRGGLSPWPGKLVAFNHNEIILEHADRDGPIIICIDRVDAGTISLARKEVGDLKFWEKQVAGGSDAKKDSHSAPYDMTGQDQVNEVEQIGPDQFDQSFEAAFTKPPQSKFEDQTDALDDLSANTISGIPFIGHQPEASLAPLSAQAPLSNADNPELNKPKKGGTYLQQKVAEIKEQMSAMPQKNKSSNSSDLTASDNTTKEELDLNQVAFMHKAVDPKELEKLKDQDTK